MKRKCLDTSKCPIARTLDVIGDWWSLLIVRDAFLGKRRFSEFHKSLGLAKNILSVRLQTLVSHGILTTGPASDGSAYREYRLTEKGLSLYLVLVALRQWGEGTSSQGELDLLLVAGKRRNCGEDGRLLGPARFAAGTADR